MADPIRALDNAIVAMLADFGVARVIDHRAVEWASATFIGARHEIAVALAPGPRDVDAMPVTGAIAARLADAEAALPGHLLADMVLADHCKAEGGLRLAIEALTLVDN